MEKLMNKMDNMELDKVAGGKVEFPKILRFLKKDTPLRSPRLAQTSLSDYREKVS